MAKTYRKKLVESAEDAVYDHGLQATAVALVNVATKMADELGEALEVARDSGDFKAAEEISAEQLETVLFAHEIKEALSRFESWY